MNNHTKIYSDEAISFTIQQNKMGEFFFHQINHNTFFDIDSSSLYKVSHQQLFSEEDTLFIIIGTDSGLLVNYINHNKARGSRYLFIEFPQITHALKDNNISLPNDKSLFYCDEKNWQQCALDNNIALYSMRNKVKIVESLGASNAYYNAYVRLVTQTHQKLETLQSRFHANQSSRIFLSRQINNIADNFIPANYLENAFLGKTCVILAGGPSLDHYLSWVKQNQENLLVIAVSRICRRLQEVNLTPDIIVSIDPTELSFDVSKEALMFKQTLLLHSFHVVSSLLAQWQSKTAYLGPRFPWQLEKTNDQFCVQPPTVTHTAISAAADMGCSQIILLGVDLCLQKNGHTHAKGSNEFDAGPRINFVGDSIETNNSQLAETLPAFSLGASALTEQAQYLQQRGIVIFNPVAYAAKVEYIVHQSLNTIRLTPLNCSASQTIQQRLPCFDSHARHENLTEALQTIHIVSNQINDVKNYAQQALTCNQKLYEKSNGAIDFSYKQKMDEIEQILDTRHVNMARFVKLYGMEHFAQIMGGDTEKHLSVEELEQLGERYYQIYITTCDDIQKALAIGKNRIKTRIEELQSEPNFEYLLAEWSRQKEPGRAKLWLDNHPNFEMEQLPSPLKNNFVNVLIQYDEQLTNKNTRHHAKIQSERSLLPIRDKARNLFKNKALDRLESIQDGLQNCDNKHAAQFRLLILGYILELKNNPTDALTRYQQINFNYLQEDSLKRTLSIYFNSEQYEFAIDVLKQLAEISPLYRPKLAELLRMTGNMQAAIDHYTDYLQKFPNDLVNMLKLGKLYQTIGILEAAAWTYNYVLSHEPNNPTAIQSLLELKNSP